MTEVTDNTRIRSHKLPPKRSADRRLVRLGMAGALLIVIVSAMLFFKQTEKKVRPKSVPVNVAVVKTADMPVELRNIGNVTPMNSVSVKSHVSGQILQTHFKEGQQVHEGQMLYSIDPRPMQAALNQATADLQNKEALVAQADATIAKDEALLNQARANRDKDVAVANNAQVDAGRYKILSQQGAVSVSQFEQFRTAAVSAKATVVADEAIIRNAKAAIKSDRANKQSALAQVSAAKAVVENARVQLDYTSVRAPISGLAGHIQILNGNLVRQDTDVLVTINQISPIYVSLTVPEQQFSEVRMHSAKGEVQAEVFDSSGTPLAQNGRLMFSDNTVDSATGTVMLKASFDNADQKLWPGQFVNVVLRLATLKNAVVVPSQAVQTGQEGTFIWVVNKDDTVQMQNITVGPVAQGLTTVREGLRDGQTVVIDGQLQLTPKAHITPSAPPAEAKK